MNHKESIVHLWFTMWLQKNDLGIQEIFSKDAVYIESWGPNIEGMKKLNFGLKNGILAEVSCNGISNNIFIKKIKLWWNGFLRTR